METKNGRGYIYVWVTACNDAHIGLSKILGDISQDTYEIVIGGWHNGRSAIRRGPQVKKRGRSILHLPRMHCGTEYHSPC